MDPDIVLTTTLRDAYLHQHVMLPTHYKGTQIPNMLDLIITIEEGMISQMVLSSPIGKRHYVCIDFMFNCYTPEQPSQKPKQIFHKGDYDAMRTDTQTMT